MKPFTSLAIKRFTSLVVKQSTSLAIHKLSGQVVHKLSGQTAHELSGHPVVNPISAGSHGICLLCRLLGSVSSSSSTCALVCGVVHLASYNSCINILVHGVESVMIIITFCYSRSNDSAPQLARKYHKYFEKVRGYTCEERT